MKLRLTIQELEDKETKEKFQGLFGTLSTRLPDPKGKKLHKEEDINFATRVDAIPGLQKIVENLTTEALALKQKEKKAKNKAK